MEDQRYSLRRRFIAQKNPSRQALTEFSAGAEARDRRIPFFRSEIGWRTSPNLAIFFTLEMADYQPLHQIHVRQRGMESGSLQEFVFDLRESEIFRDYTNYF